MMEPKHKQSRFDLPVQSYNNPGFIGDSTDDKEQETVVEVEHSRDQWSNPIEFLLSCIAMSVGLGNVWRFPFVAYNNGGGAFLIPYLIVLFFVGKPLYYMELCLGQFSSYGCVKIWGISPAFKGVGYGQALATACVVSYYVSIMGTTIYYFLASFSGTLPWSVCPPDIKDCVDSSTNLTLIDYKNSISSSEYYFKVDVIKKYEHGFDDGIYPPDWKLSLCLLGAWLILFLVLVKGVKSSGKSSYFTALFPYLVLFILLGKGLSLPGSKEGIIYFLEPHFEELLKPDVWFAAVGQSFFSLSVGFGSVIMFASYNGFNRNVHRDAFIISITDTGTSILAGCTIFSILGHLAHLMGTTVPEVIKGSGSSLAFISYPDVISRFHYAPQVFSVLFFLMLFTLGTGSASALTGCIITIICDENPHFKRWIVTLVVCLTGFATGLLYVTPQGQYMVDLIDFYGGTLAVYILCFFEVVAVQWVYGFNNFQTDIEFMLGIRPGWYWKFCWVFFMPTLLFSIFCYKVITWKPITSGTYVYGPFMNILGVLLVVILVGMLPAVFIYAVQKRRKYGYSFWESIRNSFEANEEWMPKDPKIRQEYIKFKAQKLNEQSLQDRNQDISQQTSNGQNITNR